MRSRPAALPDGFSSTCAMRVFIFQAPVCSRSRREQTGALQSKSFFENRSSMIQQTQSYSFEEVHYQLAVEAAGIGLWDWDLVLDRMVWSDKCKNIFGLPADTVI